MDKGVGAVRIPGCAKIGKPRTPETDLKEMRTAIGTALRSCDGWADSPGVFIPISDKVHVRTKENVPRKTQVQRSLHEKFAKQFEEDHGEDGNKNKSR